MLSFGEIENLGCGHMVKSYKVLRLGVENQWWEEIIF
jgi:hypothetical protein